MTDEPIVHLSELTDDELEEQWVRETDEPDLRNVEAMKWSDGEWQVGVSAAEFVREESLEGELRRAVDAALRAVPGVSDVAEEDREVWHVSGDPQGGDLVRAVAAVLDGFADRIRTHMNNVR